MKYAFYLILASCILQAKAQDAPIGSWTTHFSYQSARTVAYDGDDYIYTANENLFRYSISQQSFDIYSKVNGLSDIGIKLVRYNKLDNYLLIIYDNGNIDIMQDNNIINIADIKSFNTSGSKSINDVYFYNRLAYLSTDFGVVVLNPARREIKETYVLQLGSNVAQVNSFTLYKGQFIAATNLGLFSANENLPVLQDFINWDLLDNKEYSQLMSHPTDYLFASADNLMLFANGAVVTNWDTIATSTSPIVRIVEGAKHVYFLENGNSQRRIHSFDESGQPVEQYDFLNAFDLAETATTFYAADGWRGLLHVTAPGNYLPLTPEGPYSNSAFNLAIADNALFMCSGGHNAWIYNYQREGISKYDYQSWSFYNQYEGIAAMDSILDILDATIDVRNNYLYAASFGGGLLEIKPNGDVNVFKDNGVLQPFGGPNIFRIVDLHFDEQHNLWMSNYGSSEPLVVKKADGSWQSYAMPYAPGTVERTASEIVIDDFNQKWMVAPRNVGLFVFSDNNTLDNKADDVSKLLRQGKGFGNLPTNNVNCIAKDKDGAIWVGTTDGIAIFNCPGNIFNASGCDAELRIVQYDANAGLLFQNEIVNTIAIDGANNKWIGTGNGVWQISNDAETILKRFTIDNSPLPSNEINKIVVHPQSGDVFIATTKGLISYRSEATEGASTQENILVYPNPVPSGYTGTIAIKGLTSNADVRITDASGQLVYRVKAQGGQAVWNGQTYTGQRPMSGIYYVFVTDSEGKETKSAKFIFHE